MIALQLSPEEATFLQAQLERHREHVENELVHTDHRNMQRELARDVERIRGLLERLSQAANEERSATHTTMSREARSGAV